MEITPLRSLHLNPVIRISLTRIINYYSHRFASFSTHFRSWGTSNEKSGDSIARVHHHAPLIDDLIEREFTKKSSVRSQFGHRRHQTHS